MMAKEMEKPMSIELSNDTEALLSSEARRQGISVDALVHRLVNRFSENGDSVRPTLELPVWDLGSVGSLRRQDIYDDVV
jgi:hypothetical protein